MTQEQMKKTGWVLIITGAVMPLVLLVFMISYEYLVRMFSDQMLRNMFRMSSDYMFIMFLKYGWVHTRPN